MPRTTTLLAALGIGFCLVSGAFSPVVLAQAINVDFGEPGAGPAASYGAAGLAGAWNSLRGDHGTTTTALLGLDGQPTAVSLRQIGGLDTPTVADPSTTGDDSALLDDYLVTFSASLESCIYLAGLEPGPYEVLIYALMPNQPTVLSYTDVDQEPGNPHFEVGGAWPGAHQQLVSFSRHLATVGPDGGLQLHSGIVPGANPAAGAALNGLQIRPLAAIFEDGFESGDPSGWNAAIP